VRVEGINRSLSGLYGHLPRGTLVVTVLRIFIDESSSHDDPNQPLMLTGCVSTPMRWSRFEKRWRAALEENDLGHVRYVRWYELQRGEGEFKNTTITQRINATKALDECVFANVRFGFCTVLKTEDFQTYRDARGTSLSSRLDSDYGVSFRVAMGFMHSVLPMVVGEAYPSVYVLVEDGHENSGAVNEIHRQYQKQYVGKERIVKAVALVDKKEYAGTQAADMRGAGFLMQETSSRGLHYQDIPPDLKNVSEYTQNRQLPWFRLPLNEGVLMDIRDGLILSKRSLAERFGNLLSTYFWDSSFPPKKQHS
jgi:hypothetical protein